jgi:peptidoglycan/xylan/chitin deacetylase (PgdA/CDA1 family)
VSVWVGASFAIKYRALLNEENYGKFIDEAVKSGKIKADDYANLQKFITEVPSGSTIEYQSKYPDMYVENDFDYSNESTEKIAYLTFDDGPNIKNTNQILDTLKEYGIKATFFVIYTGDSEEMKAVYRRIVEEGHTIGIHTYTHKYKEVYASVDSYLDDFNRINEYVKEVTGVTPEIYRFPGGSLNSYNAEIHYELKAEMLRRGYTHYDWNVSSGDAESAATSKSKIVSNIVGKDWGNKAVILFHDGMGHQATAEALPEVINGLKAQGYSFAPLTKDVKPVTFS